MAIRYVSNKDSDGTSFGQTAADKIGFHGKTPVVQRTVLATLSSGSTTTSMKTAVNRIINLLKTYGFMATS